jgi:hypothetical protein
MKNARTASLTLSAGALIVLLLILVLAKGWWDYVLVSLAILMLLGSHALRRRFRSGTYREVRARRGAPTDR